jgi:hypothetical protein
VAGLKGGARRRPARVTITIPAAGGRLGLASVLLVVGFVTSRGRRYARCEVYDFNKGRK